MRAMLDWFGATADPTIAERTAKIGLLRAPSIADSARLTALAELAVNRGAADPLLPWYQLVQGMAAYRGGQFALAAACLGAAEEAITNDQIKPVAALFFAMTDARSGHIVSASSRLDRARRSLKAIAPPTMNLGPGWHDWLICQIVLREAEALILYDPLFPADPFASNDEMVERKERTEPQKASHVGSWPDRDLVMSTDVP